MGLSVKLVFFLFLTGLMIGFLSTKALRFKSLTHSVVAFFSLMSASTEIWLGTSLATILLSCSLTLGLLIGATVEFTPGISRITRGVGFLAAYPISWYLLFVYGLTELLQDGLLGAVFFREIFDWSVFFMISRALWLYLFTTRVLAVSGFSVLHTRHVLLGSLVALNFTAVGVVESGYRLSSGVPHGFLKVWLLTFPEQAAGMLLIGCHSAMLIIAGSFIEYYYSARQDVEPPYHPDTKPAT
jgi:hypothetical protein